MNRYENALATKLLATNCVCCGRALVDATSVELGIGPECRSGFNFDLTDENRKIANKLVFDASLAASHGLIEVVRANAAKIREMGFGELAEKMENRFVKAEVKADITITPIEGGKLKVVTPYRRKDSEAFIEAWRKVPGRRWVNGANEVPVESKKQLWTLLREFFPGRYAKGPKGVFKIEPLAPVPVQTNLNLK
jgi:hypothetical protein